MWKGKCKDGTELGSCTLAMHNWAPPINETTRICAARLTVQMVPYFLECPTARGLSSPVTAQLVPGFRDYTSTKLRVQPVAPGACGNYATFVTEDVLTSLCDPQEQQPFACYPTLRPFGRDPELAIKISNSITAQCSQYECSAQYIDAQVTLQTTAYSTQHYCGGNSCSGNGYCGCANHSSTDALACFCHTGYVGATCADECPGFSRSPQGSVSCCNGGKGDVVKDDAGGYSCRCHYSFAGTNCTEECAVNCGARGSCKSDRASCACDEGYAGDSCDQCAAFYWKPGSACIKCDGCTENSMGCDSTTGECICDDGFTGSQCQHQVDSTPVLGTVLLVVILSVLSVSCLAIVGVVVLYYRQRLRNLEADQTSSPLLDHADWRADPSSRGSGTYGVDREDELGYTAMRPASSLGLASSATTSAGRMTVVGAGDTLHRSNADAASDIVATLVRERDSRLGPQSRAGAGSRRVSATAVEAAALDRISLSLSRATDYHVDLDWLRPGARIGAGASGEVYRAEITEGADKGTAVAMKKLNSACVDRNYLMSAFKRELQILRHLDHPNVVRLVGVAIRGSDYYVITELCRCALNDLLARGRGFLSVSLLANLSRQLVEGMAFLHKQGVVHRDLKPANCLLRGGDETGPLTLKICDFGLSRLTSSNDLTRMTAEIGTPAYMAPELFHVAPDGQSLDGVDAGKALDVYSFAVCLLEMWTQRRPYSSQKLSVLQLMMQVHKGVRPAIPSDVVPPRVADTIERCWAGAPVDRPSFAEVWQEMRADAEYFAGASGRSSGTPRGQAAVAGAAKVAAGARGGSAAGGNGGSVGGESSGGSGGYSGYDQSDDVPGAVVHPT